MHECATCGHLHDFPETAEVLDVETGGDAEATEEVAAAAVEIAGIEADRDVKLAKIEAERWRAELREENAALRAEVNGLREAVDALTAAAAPPPVIVAPEPGPEIVLEPEGAMDAPEPEPAASGAPKRRSPWGY